MGVYLEVHLDNWSFLAFKLGYGRLLERGRLIEFLRNKSKKNRKEEKIRGPMVL